MFDAFGANVVLYGLRRFEKWFWFEPLIRPNSRFIKGFSLVEQFCSYALIGMFASRNGGNEGTHVWMQTFRAA